MGGASCNCRITTVVMSPFRPSTTMRGRRARKPTGCRSRAGQWRSCPLRACVSDTNTNSAPDFPRRNRLQDDSTNSARGRARSVQSHCLACRFRQNSPCSTKGIAPTRLCSTLPLKLHTSMLHQRK